MINEKAIINAQLEFFRVNKAGCAFAVVAARRSEKYGWFYKVIDVSTESVDSEIKKAIDHAKISTLSLVFPTVNVLNKLIELVKTLQQCNYIYLGQNVVVEGMRCLGFRVRVGSLVSWISGFGNFEYFPPTRRTPYTEIVFRVKPRPRFEWVMKESPADVIHLADMDMLGIEDNIFKRLWKSSLERTAKIIGHKPNLQSAAKTTFILPESIVF